MGEDVLVIGFLVGATVSLVAVIDAANHPRWAYEQAGFEKVLWVTIAATGIVLSWAGVAGAIWYLTSVRGKVVAARASPRMRVPGPPPTALVSAGARPAEWLPDPTRRHELRYWDGFRWSEHVSDHGEQSRDRL